MNVRLISMIAAIVLPVVLSAHAADQAPPQVQLAEKHRVLLETNCVECHGPEKQKGKFRVDELPFTITKVEDADRWQKVLNSLNAGEMPPEEERQPEREAKTEFLDALSHTLVAARKSLADQGGRITMRRLNRREYQNTIRALLGVEVDVHDLPADGGAGTFDTAGSSLFMSSDQFERYLELGKRALDEAIVSGAEPARKTQHREVEEAANHFAQARLKGFDSATTKRALAWRDSDKKDAREFGFPDNKAAGFALKQYERSALTYQQYLARPHADTGAFLTFEVGHVEETVEIPASAPEGDYVLRLRVGTAKDAPANRCFLEMGHATAGRAVFNVLGSFQVTAPIEQPQLLEIPVRVGRGTDRTFSFREKRPNSRLAALTFFREAQEKTGAGPEPALWIDWVEWEGPLNTQWPPRAHREIFFQGPQAELGDAYAREIIERFASRAFRDKAPRADFIEKLVGLYQIRRRAGDAFETALKEPLSVVLASPGFLYLAELSAEEGKRPLSDTELAVRLSYFLWSGPPDETLINAAKRGDLQKPELLAKQVDRLIGDARSCQFVRGFTHQWLGLERLDFFQFNFTLFPEFDESAKIWAKEEVFAFMQTLLRENLSARCLLKSDFAVVNGWLANYYGLPGVMGDEFVKVNLPAGSPRGGLLGMAGILAMGSNGERTSPVERGAWVLRKLVDDPPPPAPPNVPQLTRLDQQMLTARDRILAHQEQPQCASCHRKIDPVGFGLENFDAAGRWRTQDFYEKPTGRKPARRKKNGVEDNKLEWTIDPAGAFYRGASFKDFFELRDAIAAQSDRFTRSFAEALVEYGLGRPFSFSDDALAAAILEQAHSHDDAVRSFIHALVASDAFHTK